MKDLMGCLYKLIKYLFNETKENKIKDIIPIIAVIILGLIFISPSYIFIFFYKRSLFLQFSIIINIITIIILDIILFLALFFICSFRNIEVDNQGNIKSKINSLFEDVVISIFLMGFISILLVIVNGINIIIKWNGTTTKGVRVLSIILASIFICYFKPLLMKILKSINIKVINKRIL